jgi:hypothetical protein
MFFWLVIHFSADAFAASSAAPANCFICTKVDTQVRLKTALQPESLVEQ